MSRDCPIRFVAPSLTILLLSTLLISLLVAGGASRGDAIGQVVVRAVAWTCLAIVVIFGRRSSAAGGRTIFVFMIAALSLIVVQLIPLPPGWWQALPGRHDFAVADEFAGAASWRPIAIVPSTALNAAASLIVPFATLILVSRLRPAEDRVLLTILLGIAVAAMIAGLLQFAGVSLVNPFVNGGDAVDGPFANRNHYALFLAVGCLFALVWGFADRKRPGWRALIAVCLVMLFVLTILASGSRSGVLVGVLAIGVGLSIVARDVRQMLARYTRTLRIGAIAIVAVMALGLIVISFGADRAVSINRALSLDFAHDMRGRSFATVMAIAREYFPVGYGWGGFDPIFRLHEPFGLLKPTYFNRAHNDVLEVTLEAGLPGVLLLVAAAIWWTRASIRAWRVESANDRVLPRLGSIILLLLAVASLSDYPVRTPIMMAVAVIAAAWLDNRRDVTGRSALPNEGQHL